MKIEKTHVFDAPIEQVWAMFSDPDAHVAKFTRMGHQNISVVEVDSTDDSLRIVVSRDVSVDLPAIAMKVFKPSNAVTSTDEWRRNDDGTLSGNFAAETKGAPIEVKGTTLVEADGDGASRYTIVTDFRVAVPLIGKKIEGAVKGMIEGQVDEEFACCDDWLASH